MPTHDTPPSPEPPNPLAAALRARGYAASPDAPAPAAAPAAKGEINLAKNGKIVVRRERKGRHGKTVTLVSGIERATPQIEEIARAMRKALGCGSTLEGPVIVLMGDIVPRAQAWLQAHGATKIVQGT